MVVSPVLIQVCQVLTVILGAPLLHGFIVKLEEKIQRGQGPSVFQPYRDLIKLLNKELVIPETASWVFWVAPVVAFTCMLIVPILIPVLTNYPLPLSNMGDILGGGLILTLGSFAILLAGLDSGQPFGGLGSSRAVMLTILAEPTLILIFVGVSFLDHSMLPFVANHLLVRNPSTYWSPAHLFLVFGFLILLTVETDRLPIHSSIHYEIYMIDDARILEYSGPLLAVIKWSTWMKQFILYTIFLNVFFFPWGLSTSGSIPSLLLAMGFIVLKYGAIAVVMSVTDTIQSRLRFYRYQEPLALSFLFAVVALIANQI
ncbi:respiratory chain complex I subunit 1 family protein [Acidithrix ferrooxidans]|uniref:Formate hydrogenlyase subunit 4 n=1 Tax=Acidithrix ferrooxidans TaxID=1280514 RepID=A0A0D8HDG8_9ACTN|nr:NADH-quinone oxidoreductase subunit H [Acidithrix ferrooxidans]KJF15929.1 formate hydrogenlyase subunit 4 [Acidithrix ferrooxidans]